MSQPQKPVRPGKRAGGPPQDAAEALKRAFDQDFAPLGLSLPEACLRTAHGGFEQNGWEISYRFDVEKGNHVLDCLARHRRTNDRLYRVHTDGRVELVDSSTDGVLRDHDRRFHAELRRRGFNVV